MTIDRRMGSSGVFRTDMSKFAEQFLRQTLLCAFIGERPPGQADIEKELFCLESSSSIEFKDDPRVNMAMFKLAMRFKKGYREYDENTFVGSLANLAKCNAGDLVEYWQMRNGLVVSLKTTDEINRKFYLKEAMAAIKSVQKLL